MGLKKPPADFKFDLVAKKKKGKAEGAGAQVNHAVNVPAGTINLDSATLIALLTRTQSQPFPPPVQPPIPAPNTLPVAPLRTPLPPYTTIPFSEFGIGPFLAYCSLEGKELSQTKAQLEANHIHDFRMLKNEDRSSLQSYRLPNNVITGLLTNLAKWRDTLAFKQQVQ